MNFELQKIPSIVHPKTRSILSYLGLLWLLAFFADKHPKDELSSYHLRQGLGLITVGMVMYTLALLLMIFFPDLIYILYLVGFTLFLLTVFGIIHALNEVKRPVPLIGKLFENKFKFIDNYQ